MGANASAPRPALDEPDAGERADLPASPPMNYPYVVFVTPAWKRVELTAICLEQRARMIDADALPFDADCVVIADDENLATAARLGLATVRRDNAGLGAKFNAGFQWALRQGASHVMAVGSDSFLHPSALAGARLDGSCAIGTVGFSSVSHDGRHRVDVEIKYPAGFGVGMVYPGWALPPEPCDPRLMRGCDTSTWRRCSEHAGVLPIEYLPAVKHGLVNFTSADHQITPFRRLVASKNAWRRLVQDDGIDPLYDLYDHDLLDRLRARYATLEAA